MTDIYPEEQQHTVYGSVTQQLNDVLEFDTTDRIFTNPRLRGTEDYITGKL